MPGGREPPGCGARGAQAPRHSPWCPLAARPARLLWFGAGRRLRRPSPLAPSAQVGAEGGREPPPRGVWRGGSPSTLRRRHMGPSGRMDWGSRGCQYYPPTSVPVPGPGPHQLFWPSQSSPLFMQACPTGDAAGIAPVEVEVATGRVRAVCGVRTAAGAGIALAVLVAFLLGARWLAASGM